MNTDQQYFPDPNSNTVDGIIAVGGELNADILLEAYGKGIFPWPQSEGDPLLWFSPDMRGVLEFSDLHVARSLKKFRRQILQRWNITFNRAFADVMAECARQNRPGQEGTWIIAPMFAAYGELFRRGHALSCEVWDNGQLVGGIYGVLSSAYFSGESMFFKSSNASKIALLALIEKLQVDYGRSWMDVQMVTESLAQFGAKYISRGEFLRRILADGPREIC